MPSFFMRDSSVLGFEAQQLGRTALATDLATCGLQRRQNMVFLNLLQRPDAAVWCLVPWGDHILDLDMWEIDRISVTENDGALDDVLEFADIARPGIVGETLQGSCRNAARGASEAR